MSARNIAPLLMLGLLLLPGCGSGSAPRSPTSSPTAIVYSDPVADFSITYDPAMLEPFVDESAADQWGERRRVVAFRSTSPDVKGAISVVLDDCAGHEPPSQAGAFYADQFAQLLRIWRAQGLSVEREQPQTTSEGTIYAARATRDGETVAAEYELVRGSRRYAIQLFTLGPERAALDPLFRAMVESFSVT